MLLPFSLMQQLAIKCGVLGGWLVLAGAASATDAPLHIESAQARLQRLLTNAEIQLVQTRANSHLISTTVDVLTCQTIIHLHWQEMHFSSPFPPIERWTASYRLRWDKISAVTSDQEKHILIEGALDWQGGALSSLRFTVQSEAIRQSAQAAMRFLQQACTSDATAKTDNPL